MSLYNNKFYEKQKDKSYISAKNILPFVYNFFNYKPDSVIDFGCGVGTWLAAAFDLGITDLTGIEGEWVNENKLINDNIALINHNLSLPIEIERKFDMAISTEVAEHVPVECSDIFVENMVNSSDFILFSAAIRNQGGVNHINEQPQSFWINKFISHGYYCLDVIRPHFWYNGDVGVGYRQNCFIFCKDAKFVGCERGTKNIYDIVHPEVFERQLNQKFGIKKSAKHLILSLYRKLFNK